MQGTIWSTCNALLCLHPLNRKITIPQLSYAGREPSAPRCGIASLGTRNCSRLTGKEGLGNFYFIYPLLAQIYLYTFLATNFVLSSLFQSTDKLQVTMRALSVFVAVVALCSRTEALGQNATVTMQSATGLLMLADQSQSGQILLSANDWFGVLRAAEDLAGDFGKVTGKNLTLGHWGSSTAKRAVGWSSPAIGNASYPGGSFKDGNGPNSSTHDVVQTQGISHTAYYVFNPTTNVVNVRRYLGF